MTTDFFTRNNKMINYTNIAVNKIGNQDEALLHSLMVDADSPIQKISQNAFNDIMSGKGGELSTYFTAQEFSGAETMIVKIAIQLIDACCDLISKKKESLDDYQHFRS
jgi:hypothetical protein